MDISKAFDTIPHSALKPWLAWKGVPTPIINLIENIYKEGKTKIKANNNVGVEIEILRGVKQGDPLSSPLFNLCLEPLLEMIEEQTSGIIVSCERKISIVLLGEDEREAQRQMDILHKYLKDLGMNISVEKSQMFEVVAKKDT